LLSGAGPSRRGLGADGIEYLIFVVGLNGLGWF